MSSIKLKGSSSGDVTITVPAAAGTNTVTIPALTGNLPLSNLSHVTNRPNAKPIIINGDMHVAQRATSVSSLSSDSYSTVDRMKQKLNDAGTYTVSQSTDVPSGYGFTKSLKYDVTSAKDSPSSGTLGSLDYHVEAQDLQLLNYGTSGAKKITFSFWVKSPKTGTHILSITSPDGNRHISKAYTVSSANTWENHICNFDGDTGGTINDDNGSGFQLQWLLVAGSSYQSGTLQTSWGSYTQANTYVGQVNVADSTSNDFFITGIQMEIGEFTSATIPSFQHESFGDSLRRCQRYCQVYGPHSNTMIGVGRTQDASSVFRWDFTNMKTSMRAAPSGAISGTVNLWNGGTGANAQLGTSYNTTELVGYDLACSAGLTNTTGIVAKIFLNTGTFTLTAEL